MYVLFFRLNVDLKALSLCGQVRVRDDENFNFKFFSFLFLKDFKNSNRKVVLLFEKKKQKFNSKVKKNSFSLLNTKPKEAKLFEIVEHFVCLLLSY